MKLSNQDLPYFFEDHHHTLAERLTSIELTSHDAKTVAKAMGKEHDLYRWLIPDAGRTDVRALCLIREALGYLSPMADSIFAVQGLGSFPLVLAADETQKKRYLPLVKAGKAIHGFALTEPEAGSDVASMQTQARREAGYWRLSGEKVFISNVGIASRYVVFANADPSLGRKGITAFIVEKDAKGLELEAMQMSVDHPIGRLRMDGCSGELLGEVGGGFKLAMQTLDSFRTSVGAAAVGMARRALEAALEHVKNRVQFGKALIEQQQVQAYLADMATELDASRLLVLRAAHAKDTGDGRATREVSMAKLYATEAAQRIIDKAVQLFGGLGVTSGNVAEQLYREIRPLRIYEGTTEIQKLIIARSLAKEA